LILTTGPVDPTHF